MPTYEFRCPDGTIIERVYKMSEVPDAIPSPAGDGMATRIISGGADLIFKGSGFYITDYGKDGKKDVREKQKAKSEGGATKAEGSGAKGEGAGAASTPAAPAAADKPASSGGSTSSAPSK